MSSRGLTIIRVAFANGMFLLTCAFAAGQVRASESNAPRARTFRFTYAAVVEQLPPGKTARIWLPLPPSDSDQDATIESERLPAAKQLGRDQKYGNAILYLEAPAGKAGSISLEITYRITRREVKEEAAGQRAADGNANRFLGPDAHVPITGKPLELIQGKELPGDQVAAARVLYDVVNNHMTYKKVGTGWGRGDSVWACENGYGNCSDFHSLFISLARSQGIPAKFEIGFPLPEERGSGEIAGYHCWAKFRPSGRNWIPVDISEANKNPKLRDYYFGNLTADRVTFSTGRDLELVPPQKGAAINFFVYPYVEVDGKPYERMRKKFTFKDLHK